MDEKRGLYIITHGCQMNEYDSSRMALSLADEYVLVDRPENADLIIMNTCSVREKPQKKVLDELAQLKSYKRNNPELLVVVTGCVAQQEKAKLLEASPVVDLVLGPDEEQELRDYLEQVRQGQRLSFSGFQKGGFHLEPLEVPEGIGRGGKISVFVAAQKGCDRFCSYCIVPLVRGREKSRPLPEILQEIQTFVRAGVREVTLLGQNINSYGADFSDGPGFDELLQEVAQIDDLWRIRFVTSHPAAMTDIHIQAIAKLPKVCKYLHLPIQAGSNRILNEMNRGYTVEDYLELVTKLRAQIPGLALSGDMIVGFPGETEDDFAGTLEVIKKVQYDTLFSFVYSSRPGTKASRMDDPVPRKQKLEWLAILQEAQKRITLQANQALIGSVQDVLVEDLSKKSAKDLSGRTDGNKIVNFTANPELLGRLVSVRITDAHQNSLRGEWLP